MTKKHSVRNHNRKSNSKNNGIMPSSSAFLKYKDWLTERMNGGAYSVNVESQIAGQPVYDSYPDRYAPALINGKLEVTAPGSSCGAMARGGARKNHKNHKASKKRSNQRKHRGGARKHTKAVRRNRSMHKSRAQLRRHRGGSMPASYPDAFNGETSNFVDDMSKRDLGCSQPSWGPTCA
jgi:hypothetical protein